MSPGRFAFVAAAALIVPTTALAAHGTAGLWTSTTTVTAPGAPPQARTSTYCMTAAEAASDAPANATPGCIYSNLAVAGRTYTADMVCRGQFNATGHIVTTYDSDTHYDTTITMAMPGMTLTNNVTGRWVKADCADAQR